MRPDGAVLADSSRFAVASTGRALWQLTNTVLLWGLWLGAFSAWASWRSAPLFGLVLAPLIVRTFVLQHDAGHGSLLGGAGSNRWVGRTCAAITGVPFTGWSLEHAWHHQHQGHLDHRGVDRLNSPMTVAEAHEDPQTAALRVAGISAPRIFALGAMSLVLLRKRARGFFFFRPRWRWPTPHRPAVVRSVRRSWVSHGLFQVGMLWLLGPTWLLAMVPAWFVAAGVGATLFWQQHNFERTWHASAEDWSFVRVAVQGSSYLRLPRLAAFFTADIGLHHVHHLNPRIPNHRLEEARRAIPELAAVGPLSWHDVRQTYRRVFWDEDAQRMVTAPPTRR